MEKITFLTSAFSGIFYGTSANNVVVGSSCGKRSGPSMWFIGSMVFNCLPLSDGRVIEECEEDLHKCEMNLVVLTAVSAILALCWFGIFLGCISYLSMRCMNPKTKKIQGN